MNPMIWLIAAVVLVGLEAAIPGVYLLWVGLGALAAGLASAVGIDSLLAQCLIFSAASLSGVWWAHKARIGKSVSTSHPTLNRRQDQLIGRQVMLPSELSSQAYVMIDDTRWPVHEEDVVHIEPSTLMEVVSFDQGRLRIKPVHPVPPLIEK